MITLKTLEGKEFKIVNSYDELSLGQYTDIIKLSESKIKLDGVAADIEMIALLSDNPTELKDYLWNIPQEDFNELTSYFDWVADNTILDSYKNLKPKESVMINDKEFGVIINFNKITLNEKVTLETILADTSDLHKLDVAFATILRPIKDGKLIPFNMEVFDEVIKHRYDVKLMDIYATLAFFLIGEKKLTTKTTKPFSIQVI